MTDGAVPLLYVSVSHFTMAQNRFCLDLFWCSGRKTFVSECGGVRGCGRKTDRRYVSDSLHSCLSSKNPIRFCIKINERRVSYNVDTVQNCLTTGENLKMRSSNERER